MRSLGIDIGGTGIKGAPVELPSGEILAEHLHLPTPQPATPRAVSAVIQKMVRHFQFTGQVGVGFPGVIRQGVVGTAVNLSPSWVGKNAEKIFKKAVKLQVSVINDADAAGLAEVHHGAGKKEKGTVVLITLGTGIGSAVFIGGELVPNTELGHLPLHGKDAEKTASAKAREKHDWGWKKWSKRVREYLQLVEKLINPDLIIVGGGVSRRAEKWLPRASQGIRAKVVPAKLHNEAGIVGAAMAAAKNL
ncbi:MAG: ROK family protein [Verrucomicrobia bacterium]|nr:ROK family protein [Verrucomicrobiota bacterium]